jgi:hypothetical protein
VADTVIQAKRGQGARWSVRSSLPCGAPEQQKVEKIKCFFKEASALQQVNNRS